MTTKTAHTPGPWSPYQPPYSDQMQVRDEAEEIIIAAIPKKDNPSRARANARLIAMAPRMVESLRDIVVYASGHTDSIGLLRAKLADCEYTARAILRALDTPDAPCPVSPESKEPCPVCGPAKR